ncbi:APC family permease [Candidatus Chlorohelix sp.]|uniref:APC family permease n=1 Tax=Candidatus Chlorohelix sp. TaxID=3139201 RepID=UPI00306481EF
MSQEIDPSQKIETGSGAASSANSGTKRQSFKVSSKTAQSEIITGQIDNAVALPDPRTSNEIANTAAPVGKTTPSSVPEKDENDWYEEPLRRGKKPGDRYVRIAKSTSSNNIRYQSGLSFTAKATSAPRTTFGRSILKAKRFLIGQPIASSEAQHQRLSKVQALAVLSSDALSSTAYATEAILLVLILTGRDNLSLALPISMGIGLLLIIVSLSYRQTIAAYPKGGGSYIVAKDNLGVTPGLVAAASLLIDYVLTVAVSISAGVSAITSAFPGLNIVRSEICLLFIAFITLANLRGVRESGMIFTLPTYLFIFSISLLLILGFINVAFGFSIGNPVTPPEIELPKQFENISLFVILRAFASGCTAMTGIEAISDGVPAFRAPEAKNARATLTWMATILVILFIGISFLSSQYHIVPIEETAPHYETLISQLTKHIVGDSPFYFVVSATTALILVLAANTAFSDFPRLSWFLARDRFMPNLFKHQGDRLAFSTGIIALGFLAGILIVIFDGNTNALLPLYAVGVFTSFTLSQAGMVVRWWRLRTPGWGKNIAMNGLGCLTTFVVLLVIAFTKFLLGAWLVVALIPILYLIFLSIHRHYSRFGEDLTVSKEKKLPKQVQSLNMEHHTVVVPVSNLNQVTLRTLSYAKALSDEVVAVFVSDSSEAIDGLREKWDESGVEIPLVGVETPYRNVIGALLTYIDDLHRQDPDETITVVIPEFVTAKWWQRLLHNQTAFRLRAALHNMRGVVITSVPYHLER